MYGIDFSGVAESEPVLELGVGQNKIVKHSVTLDINPASIAEVIHDLDVFPYPFQDNTFQYIIAEHVLEHLDDVVKTMAELHRITKPGGVLCIQLPYFASSDFFTDPTHKHSFTSRSFDYFIPGRNSHLYNFHYASFEFKMRRVHVSRVGYSRKMGFFWRNFERWANAHLSTYESNMAFTIPMNVLVFELEVVKS